ncbi:MAG TPA: erythromycin esterase family protein [Candidatus Baltobacteraceae bacterium]|nr:erythromycin esterase family protein [Candidatus Baltobacteraceae bacterium]
MDLRRISCAMLTLLFSLAPIGANAGTAPATGSLENEPALISALRSRAVVLESGAFSADDLNVAPIAQAAGNARIIGLGEGSHGTSEFYQIKDRVLRYLVEHQGFTVLAMEGDWSEWTAVNRFVQTGDGTAADVLRNQDYAMYRTVEMRNLIEWLRSYNASVPSDRMVSVVGIDFQEPAKTFAIVADYVQRHSPGVAPTLAPARGCFVSTGNNGGPPLDTAEISACDLALSQVDADISQPTPAVNEYDKQLTRQAISILRRGEPMRLGASVQKRDHMMALNVEWLANTLHPNARIVVSTHDAHVCTCAPYWYIPMGSDLRKAFGTAYYSLGMLFGTGTVRAHPRAGNPSFIPIQLGQAPQTRVATLFDNINATFFLDVDAVPAHSPLGEWLGQPQSLWMPGGVIDPRNVKPYALGRLSLGRSFDGIVYVPTSHATSPL